MEQGTVSAQSKKNSSAGLDTELFWTDFFNIRWGGDHNDCRSENISDSVGNQRSAYYKDNILIYLNLRNIYDKKFRPAKYTPGSNFRTQSVYSK